MNEVGLKIENNKEILDLFNDLTPKVQDKVVNDGFKGIIRSINKQAKTAFNGVKKNKSKTNYEGFNQAFDVKTLKNGQGVIGGLKSKKGYKYRFINYGTEERFYTTKKGNRHDTGKITEEKWWTNTVENNENMSIENVSKVIIKSMEKTVEKYDRKYRM